MPLIIGAVLGIPIGIFFLLASDESLIKFTLGIVLIGYSAYCMLLKMVTWRLPGWTGYIFGFLAGSLGGAFNITGPPVVFYLSTQNRSKINTFGSLNFFFFVTSILVVLFHVAIGNITKDITVTFLEFTPAMIIGMLSGRYLFKRLSEDRYRRGLYVLLMAMGTILIVQPLFSGKP